MTLTLMDWFAGAGGSSQGAHAVPGVDVRLAANHWDLALETHATNFPDADHKVGDIRDQPVYEWPTADIFWASPDCTKWSLARGKKRTFDRSRQEGLFDPRTPEEIAQDNIDEESRALMPQVAAYVEGCHSRGRIIKAGIVENVPAERSWDGFGDWLNRFHRIGYKTRVIALNSMHAQAVRTRRAPQSRTRLYVGFWHQSLGRDPDWDKWLRPTAWCPACDEQVRALQVFKDPRKDMGMYRSQYVYRCPHSTCRNTIVEPEVLPALAAIDLTLPTRKIGEGKPGKTFRPYAAATVTRVKVGMERYWVPLLTPAGGTWRTKATPATEPMPTRTTRETDGLALPPLLVPTEGRDGKTAQPVTEPGRTQTTRRETGIAFPPFIIPMRGGGDKEQARPVNQPLHTVTAGGNHHGLITPEPLLVSYYGNGSAKPVSEPVGALTTRDRYALAQLPETPPLDVNEVGFRMLEPQEIARGMAFDDGYVVLGDKRAKVKQYGNAVTPPAAEVLISALVECISGEDLDVAPERDDTALAA